MEFIGRLHPLWVHLPIGFLLLAVLFFIFSKRGSGAYYDKSIILSLVLGSIAALVSCITGYLLSLSGDYDEELVARHQNVALVTTALSVGWLYIIVINAKLRWQYTVGGLMLAGLLLTGHLGGSLTHGTDYLWPSGKADDSLPAAVRKPLSQVNEALLYADVVQPILSEKCYSCHGPDKQKARLRLDQPQRIVQGGEDGAIVVAGRPDLSEMIKRIHLPLTAKAHMPPRDQSPLSAADIALLSWWVETGLSFDKKVGALNPPASITAYLTRFGQADHPDIPRGQSTDDWPTGDAPAPDPAALDRLRQQGIMVMPVALQSHWLQASCYSADSISDQRLLTLLPLKNQLVALHLGQRAFTDSALAVIGQLTQLRRLHLEHTRITDQGLSFLAPLRNLRYLNLSGTAVTPAGLRRIPAFPQLRNLYVGPASLTEGDAAVLRRLFPLAQVDTGGYRLPSLETDTQIVVPKKLSP